VDAVSGLCGRIFSRGGKPVLGQSVYDAFSPCDAQVSFGNSEGGGRAYNGGGSRPIVTLNQARLATLDAASDIHGTSGALKIIHGRVCLKTHAEPHGFVI
jgi:hypothetical protein